MAKEKMLFAVILVAAVAIVLAAIAKKLKSRAGDNADRYPYTKADSLFTAAERSFLGVLQQAVGDQFAIFGKVRIADIAKVKNIPDRSARQRATNKITSKHLDFVLCDQEKMSFVCGIELNDKSHQRQGRQDRDNFVENLCKKIELPLITIPAQRSYSVSELRTAISKALNGGAEEKLVTKNETFT